MSFDESKSKSVYWLYLQGNLDGLAGVDEPTIREIEVLDVLTKKINSGEYGDSHAKLLLLIEKLKYLSAVFDGNSDNKRKYSEVIDLRVTLHNEINPFEKEGSLQYLEQAFLRCFSVLFQIDDPVYDKAWTADLSNPDKEAGKGRRGVR